MAFEIATPSHAAGSGFDLGENLGALCVFIGVSLETDIPTKFDKTNAARVALTCPLDKDNAGEVYYDSLIFGKAIVPMLTRDRKPIVAGRVAQGEAKGSFSPPWILEDPTDKEIKAIQSWLEENIEPHDDGTYSVKNPAAAEDAPF